MKNGIFLFGIPFLFLGIFTFLYYANEDSDDVIGPHFLLSNCNQHDKMQLFAKFKNNLRRGFRAPLNFRKFKPFKWVLLSGIRFYEIEKRKACTRSVPRISKGLGCEARNLIFLQPDQP